MATAQGTTSTELPTNVPSKWVEYHNRKDALATLRTLRADDDVECQCEVCLDGSPIRNEEGDGSNSEDDDHTDAESYDNKIPTQARTKIPFNDSRDYNPLESLNHPRFRTRRSMYERLSNINRGKRGNRHSKLHRDQKINDEDRIVHTIANQIDMSGTFVERAVQLLNQIQIQTSGREEPLLKYALAALSLTHEYFFYTQVSPENVNIKHRNVGGDDGGSSIPWHDIDTAHKGNTDPIPILQDAIFSEMMEQIDFSYEECLSLRRKLLNKTNFPTEREFLKRHA